MDKTESPPSNIKIEEVTDESNKKIGYRAIVQVTENDSITSPIFQNKEEAIQWAKEKNNSFKTS
ncbi:hypothetical protein HYU93_00025 [Candidatus Daviesbacteria bacterium]|nr:hypothetical protein [Candidatus Daviesbacteria bacterium]